MSAPATTTTSARDPSGRADHVARFTVAHRTPARYDARRRASARSCRSDIASSPLNVVQVWPHGQMRSRLGSRQSYAAVACLIGGPPPRELISDTAKLGDATNALPNPSPALTSSSPPPAPRHAEASIPSSSSCKGAHSGDERVGRCAGRYGCPRVTIAVPMRGLPESPDHARPCSPQFS
jgi:hypothetical protein